MASGNHTLLAKINYGKQSWEVPFHGYTNSSYGYPVQFRKHLSLPHDDTLSVKLSNKNGGALNLTNVILSMAPTFAARA